MKDRFSLAAFVLALACGAPALPDDVIAPNPDLKAVDIPPIPASLGAKIARTPNSSPRSP